jgi:DNA-directed RNA polymerase sigma subunit (sigma70/sigma32)
VLSLDEWQALGIVCGALLALAAVVRLAVKGVHRMFHLLRQAGEFFKQVNGDDDHPSMMDLLQETRATSQDNADRLQRIEQGLAEHLEKGHPLPHLNGPVPVAPLRSRRR